ncbi:helix-turn-helix domain-containing protein [Corynebacterium pseudopelargi]|uniref:Anaerobic benzoate catabolism transcriptional regulator n=1 Tax=Corynebacterium pseudopelargi TaxID=2080757 RepID=A0A3G6IW44_9CORY|nr:helix-turn-helix transcriptional regulator [Corynebacterium pseudopelargi]AZA09867.1 anaerobic benzoate catabolism transcriptional regulator [Corynebacterium pseudopelargi]
MAAERQAWSSYGYVFGRRLQRLRTMRGLSQDRLAELADVSRNQISNLERNNNNGTSTSDPTMSMVYTLARALHVPPAALLPNVGGYVTDVCPDTADLAVEVVWPNDPTDTLAFDVDHLFFALPGDAPSFALPRGNSAAGQPTPDAGAEQ